jgi:hypothetical protein
MARVASDKDRDWTHLRDGQRLHAAHLFQLADHATEAAARSARAVGSAGFFLPELRPAVRTWTQPIAPTPQAAAAAHSEMLGPPVNHFDVDVNAGKVRINNLALVTEAGFPLLLPPPVKTIELPPAGTPERYLNAHASNLHDTQGRTDVALRWENQPTREPRSVALLERSPDGVRILPLPHTPGAVTSARGSFHEVQLVCAALYNALIEIEHDGLLRLRLAYPQRPSLDSLVTQLGRVLRHTANTPLNVVLPELEAMADEVIGWMHHITQATVGGHAGHDHAPHMPDAIGRQRLHRMRGRAALPEHLASLNFPVKDTTHLLQTLAALHGGVTSLLQIVRGESDETLLEPIDSYEPWAGAIGYVYIVDAYVGRSIELRCEVFAQYEPQLLCGLGKTNSQPNLRHSPLDPSGQGRFEALLDPFQPQVGDMLIVVLGTVEAKVRLFLRRAV